MFMFFSDRDMDAFLRVFESESFVCSQCKRIIFPKVTADRYSSGKFHIEQDVHQVRGGRGNGLIADCICKKCAERMRLHDDGGI